ncbi:methyl-accepting chemotaxis protein [Bacillus carboniphilus]|uniref:Methyl-accepting chemotaxis protein n=2 Tax=Bacillus carboniphilus TaxID=86663 RepID=A0ABY9JVI9_9BACI|nr:methyl-accepting chemotaxis protein [Bacillus carboniphilus]WLR41660.1 methyl-accepting chemotaxis protein [Bacillus carboniphilus]
MGEKRVYRFGLQKKIFIFVTILAIITYTTTGLFLYKVYPFFEEQMSELLFTCLVLAFGVFWSSLFAYFAAGFIVKPLKAIEKVVENASHGNIKETVPVPKNHDEIRSLSEAFNRMLTSFREIVIMIEENFNHSHHQLQKICDLSESSSEQATNISSTVFEISKGAEQSAAAIQQTAEAVEDVIKIAGEVERKANTSEQLAEEMVNMIDQSISVFHSLITGIQSLAQENETSMKAVNRLEEHAHEVESIVSLVGDIANQTNLLALNASIEASRAGEHGKGFAVVAEEVRKLADQSANAVNGITEKITSIQNEVKNVVEHISNNVDKARQEAEEASSTEKILGKMNQSVQEVSNAVHHIRSLVQEQMVSIEQTGAQSEEVAAIAEQTSAGAQDVTSSTEQQAENMAYINELTKQLTKSANQLNLSIKQFKI